jgi:hypothetical protein
MFPLELNIACNLQQAACRRIIDLTNPVGTRTVATSVERQADFLAAREIGISDAGPCDWEDQDRRAACADRAAASCDRAKMAGSVAGPSLKWRPRPRGRPARPCGRPKPQ